MLDFKDQLFICVGFLSENIVEFLCGIFYLLFRMQIFFFFLKIKKCCINFQFVYNVVLGYVILVEYLFFVVLDRGFFGKELDFIYQFRDFVQLVRLVCDFFFQLVMFVLNG